MRSPLIPIGLSFIGFGALIVVVLLLYLNTIEQISQYWYQYVGFVNFGVAGMFMLGREAMPPLEIGDRGELKKN